MSNETAGMVCCAAMSDVTRLLEAADRGDRQAAGQVEATEAASVLARVDHLDRVLRRLLRVTA